jgi:hypothetical protein
MNYVKYSILFNPEGVIWPNSDWIHFSTFQISLLCESIHHKRFFGGT